MNVNATTNTTAPSDGRTRQPSFIPALIIFISILFPLPEKALAVALDSHMHIFSKDSWGKHIVVESVLKEMENNEVERAVVISAGYFGGFWSLVFGRSYDKVKRENDYVAEVVKTAPNRLIGACGVHPFDEWALTEMKRCFSELGFQVLKVHPNAQRIDLLDQGDRQRLKEFLAEAAKLRAVILFHAYGKNLEFQESAYRLASEIPETRFIFAHMFGDYLIQIVDKVKNKALPNADNIFLDISGTIIETKDLPQIAQAMRAFGMDRILFGSDYPAFSVTETREAIKKLGLSPAEVGVVLSNKGPLGDTQQTFGTKKDCGPTPPGGTFDENCAIIPVPPPHLTRQREEEVFHRIHQAIGLLEEYAKGRCPLELVQARTLNEDKRDSYLWDEKLKNVVARVKRLSGGTKTFSVSEIEKLREELHALQADKKYPHERKWHDEIQRCRL